MKSPKPTALYNIPVVKRIMEKKCFDHAFLKHTPTVWKFKHQRR